MHHHPPDVYQALETLANDRQRRIAYVDAGPGCGKSQFALAMLQSLYLDAVLKRALFFRVASSPCEWGTPRARFRVPSKPELGCIAKPPRTQQPDLQGRLVLAAPTKALRDELTERLQAVGVDCLRIGTSVDQQDLLSEQILALHELQHPGRLMNRN